MAIEIEVAYIVEVPDEQLAQMVGVPDDGSDGWSINSADKALEAVEAEPTMWIGSVAPIVSLRA